MFPGDRGLKQAPEGCQKLVERILPRLQRGELSLRVIASGEQNRQLSAKMLGGPSPHALQEAKNARDAGIKILRYTREFLINKLRALPPPVDNALTNVELVKNVPVPYILQPLLLLLISTLAHVRSFFTCR